MRYIEDLKDNDHVIEHYLCRQKQNMKTRSGKSYLSLKLQDKTGTLDGKVWEMTNDIQSFEEGDIIKIDGIVLLYQNDLQVKISRIRRSLAGEYNMSEFIPTTEKDIEALYAQAVAFIQSVTHPHIRTLLENILVNNEEIVQLFKSHTAAKNMHHSYMGGLIEHTVSVTQICDFMSGRSCYVNRDLLIATALLHDIGKIYELSKMPGNDYTDDGQMLGHILIGTEMVTAEAAKIPGFPHELQSLMKHSILAHHGELEFGSPKLPSTLEAFILHCADNMDAKVKTYEDMIDQNKTPGPWTGFSKMLNRYVRKSDLADPMYE